jgi:Rps23 Pro-64 3,4-dihydroxylase Tpa1-like proline 4-hydroxylase
MIREDINWLEVTTNFKNSTPFNHVVIDDFFLPEIAEEISNEFPDYNDDNLIRYENVLENKRTTNRWDVFGKRTYQAFALLGRPNFMFKMRELVGEPNTSELKLDHGLHGGGYHMHGSGGNLNIHLDYNIHPKIGEQRKLNIIIYMTKDWNKDWGGGLELWSSDENGEPKEMSKMVENVFNRAVIFDTTQNSWHGLPKNLTCPEGVYRKSLAAYYVQPAPSKTDPRKRALYVPREDQKNDENVKDFIKKRVADGKLI